MRTLFSSNVYSISLKAIYDVNRISIDDIKYIYENSRLYAYIAGSYFSKRIKSGFIKFIAKVDLEKEKIVKYRKLTEIRTGYYIEGFEVIGENDLLLYLNNDGFDTSNTLLERVTLE